MATTPSDSGPVDAAELGRREFTKLRKGWDPVEVRAHLLRMADEITRLQKSEAELRAQVARHEASAADRAELDEALVTQMLGEETARVLEAARTAASEIRTKAEDNAGRLVREAQEQAARVVRDADETRLAATREADDLVGAARQRAEEILSEAREAAEQARSDAEAEASATRERAERAASEARAEAEADAERMRNAAAEVKAEADEHATKVRQDADEAATSTRTAAEAAAAELRSEAEAAADRIRTEAADAAHARAEEAARAAEAEVERAREQGRTMVQEAKDARERMLRDLAERRKVARQQLEALRAGRERLLEAFRSVRGVFDEATDELVESLPAARSAADDAAKAVDDDIDAAVAELDAEIPGAFEPEAAPDTGEAAEPVLEPDEPDGSGSDDGGSRLRLVHGEVDDSDLDEEDEDDDEDESGEPAARDGASASVEDLFARLRADQDSAGEATEPEASDESSPTEGAVVISLEAERDEIAEVVELAHDEESDAAATNAILDRRDDRLATVERDLTRRFKRVLSDQENKVLHAVRSDRKAKSPEALLGDASERAALVVDAAVAELIPAVQVGAGLYDEDHDVPVDAATVAAGLGPLVREWLVDPLRDRLERVVTEGDLGGDRSEIVEGMRAAYRELRNERLPELVGDLITAACNQGVLESSRPGTSHVWLVDHGGLPCPDGEDNHLAGAVTAGEPFPTGDLRPPAQPGCRCLLVPSPR